MVKRSQVRLYRPHEGQRPFHESEARFRVCANGRRFGKTIAGANDMLLFVLNHSKTRAWWVAPVMDQAARVFEEIADRMHPLITKKSITDKRIVFGNGSEVEFKSAHEPDHLRGVGLDYLVVDEAADVDEDAYFSCLRPALSDRRGRAIFISTPKGRNWFYRMYLKGQDPAEPDYRSWQFPTWMNPYIDPAEEAAAREVPRHVYRQEYEAAFLEDEDTVFRDARSSIGSRLRPAQAEESYVFGLDLGRAHDFTVLVGFETRRREMVYFNRFRGTGYSAQKELIARAVKDYRARLVMDSTGVGEPIFDDFRRDGLDVTGYHFTEGSKRRLVENLIVEMDARRVCIADVAVLTAELEAFRYVTNRSGRLSYEGPSGGHDDCVIALALAVWGLRGRERPAHVLTAHGSVVFPAASGRVF
jgi:phage FluMu gp28-like protein